MPIANRSQNDDRPEPAPLRPRIAGMGYRLAAAGPRTRQRLVDRESAFPPPDEVRYAIPLASILPQHDTPWPAPIDETPDEPLARLSLRKRGLPPWRSLALATAALCGFSLVIFAQTLHLDRKAHLTAQASHSAPADAALEEIALDARHLVMAASETQVLALNDDTGASLKLPPQLDAAPPAQAAAIAPPGPAALALSAPPPSAPPQSPTPARASPSRQYAALPSVPRHFSSPNARTTLARLEPRRASPRPVLYKLPAWLTRPQPATQAQLPRELVMSPPPRTLDDQLAAKDPPAPQQPASQRGLPPPPAPHGPPIIYAEAHYPQPVYHLPPPVPYYPPYYGYGGYYQPQPYYRPPQNVW